MQSPVDIATEYTSRGWSVVPIPHRAKRPTVGGWPNLRLSEDQIPNHFNGRPQNVGVLLGEASRGLVDVDLDCSQALALADRLLPPTEGIFGRESKRRSHRLYVATSNVPAKTERFQDVAKDAEGKTATLVELRSNGGQTVFPGSEHESGEAILWDSDQPNELDGNTLAHHVAQLAAACLLARHWPGQGVRHDLELALTGALVRAGWDEQQAADYVDVIARTGGGDARAKRRREGDARSSSLKLQQGQPATGWPTVARLLGEHGSAVVDRVRVWLGVADDTEVEPAGEEEAVIPPFPDELLYPPGHVGEIVSWINQTAIKPQPALALANALAFWGVVVGRKVAMGRSRTNLYCLGVGESGSGKDHSRQAIKAICEQAGLSSELLGGEEIASDTGLMKAVQRQPSILFQIDEIGHFLSNANSKYAGTHQRNIGPAFTKLFTSAHQRMIGKEFASGDRIEIDQPNVGLYGTTVPSRLYEGLSPGEISDGFLARMLVFRSDDPDPLETDNDFTAPPDEVVHAVINWYRRDDLPRAAGNVAAVIRHNPIPIHPDDDAKAEFRRLGLKAREMKTAHRDGSGLDSLWARAPEHARKVALTIASGCGFEADELTVTGDIASYACRLVEFVIGQLVGAVKESVAGSDAERNVQVVLRAIKSGGLAGIAKTVLLRRTQSLRKRDRDEALEHLLETRQIGERKEPSARGPASSVYYLARNNYS